MKYLYATAVVLCALTTQAHAIEDSYRIQYGDRQEKPDDWVLRSSSPVPPATGPYSLKNKREPNGAITVDSAATWNRAMQSWVGKGPFVSVENGYTTSPSQRRRVWTWSGGIPDSNTQFKMDQGNVMDISGTQGTQVDLDGSQDGTGMVAETMLKVKVTDTDKAVGENTMKVRWHLPAEIILLDDERTRYNTHTELLEPTQFTGGQVAVEGGVLLCQIRKDEDAIKWWFQDASHTLGDVANSVGEGVAVKDAKTGAVLMLLSILLTRVDVSPQYYSSVANTLDTFKTSVGLTADGTRICVPGLSSPISDVEAEWRKYEMTYPLLAVFYDDWAYRYNAYDYHGFVARKTTVVRWPKATSPTSAGDYKLKRVIQPPVDPTS